MSNHILSLLTAWSADQSRDWVLGTIVKTTGSAYRKAGSMMLINTDGQYFGMLSGGCLESDIVRHARQVLSTRCAKIIEYDSTDEDDWSHQLGIGCGGRIELLLQLVSSKDNRQLNDMFIALSRQQSGFYEQNLSNNQAGFSENASAFSQSAHIINRHNEKWLITPVKPEPHLLIIGGGRDAIPVMRIAIILGWSVTVTDPRPANARYEQFIEANRLLRITGEELTKYIDKNLVDAVIVMSHSLSIDASGLNSCLETELKYLALLGPRHRFEQVMALANLTEDQLPCQISAPAGFDIGGQLPESIALSIISECHAVLHDGREQGKPLVLNECHSLLA